MNSIFKLNKLRRDKLKEILKLLFLEYKFISIKRNGIVKFRKKYWFFSCKSIHVSELCINEIPTRLSRFRQGDELYTPIYNQYLETIIYYKIKNVIDYLYFEFLKIKRDSKIEILTNNSNLLLEATQYETIGDILNQSKEVKKKPIYHIKSKKIKDIKNLYDSLIKESNFDKFQRTKFLL